MARIIPDTAYYFPTIHVVAGVKAKTMVADETVTCDAEKLLSWLTEKGHPVLDLEPLM